MCFQQSLLYVCQKNNGYIYTEVTCLNLTVYQFQFKGKASNKNISLKERKIIKATLIF